MTAELDALVSIISVVGTPGLYILVGAVGWKFYSSLNELARAYTVLNHNGSAVVKALLAKGILRPEDVQTVEVL